MSDSTPDRTSTLLTLRSDATRRRGLLLVQVIVLLLAALPSGRWLAGAAPPPAARAAEIVDCNANGVPDARDTSAITFDLPRVGIAEGADLRAAATADFDGDGALDLVTARPLSLHRNAGGGRFRAPSLIDQRSAIAVVAADFDGDGDDDIVAGNESLALLFINAGTGSFAAPIELALPFRLQRLAIADIDADGDPDVLAAGIVRLAVLFNDRGSLAAGPMTDAPIAYPTRLLAVDFDGDTDLDVLVGDSGLGVALNTGGGALAEALLVWDEGRGAAWAAGDLDGDGDIDLVAGSDFSGIVRIGRNDAGAFVTADEIELRGLTDLDLEDRDADGDLDVVVLADGQLSLLRNDGAGRFTLAATAAAMSGGETVTGEFDGDGYGDTVILGSFGMFALVRGSADGTFVAADAVAVGYDPTSVASGDFDDDGDPDFAVTNYASDTVSIVRSQGGALLPPVDVAAGEQPSGVASADLDDDGDLDLVVGHADSGIPTSINRISVLANDGAGGFATAASLEAGSAPHEILLTDLNGDRRPDIVAGGYFSDVAVFLNQGGTFAPRRLVDVAGVSYRIAAGDIDRDGDIDLAVTGGQTNYLVTLLRNAGDATFTAETLRVDAGETWGVNFADLDRDGDLDLVIQTFYGDIVVAHNKGARFNTLTVNDLAVQGSRAAVGDVDGDGDPDLAMATSRGAIAVLRHAGGGIFTANDFFAGGSNPTVAALAESGGGGAPDLIIVDRGSRLLVSPNLTEPANSEDCDANRVPDECELAGNDCDGNAVLDRCQIDSDRDTVADVCDLCPFVDDRLDGDADRRPDCSDNCPVAANTDQSDADGDGLGNACDGCPTDVLKAEPGPCGCGNVEVDRDRDGVIECSTACSCDCNGDRRVTVAELIRAVNIAVGFDPIARCRAADLNSDRGVAISELVGGVQRLLFGCP